MNTKSKIVFSLLAIVGIFSLSACGCKAPSEKQYSLKLEVWGFLDDREALLPIFDSYMKLNQNVTSIEYKKLTRDTYQKEVVDALASGQGPDIFLINNNWLTQFQDKIAPAPFEIINQQEVMRDFVDTVNVDFVSPDGQVWAVPLSVDSLGLYYNKDLFNEAGISTPPKNWDEFTEDVRKLTKVDNFGEIRQSGVAMGTAWNVNRASDILSLLILQSGSQIVDRTDGRVVLDETVTGPDGSTSSAGEGALNFYTQFARIGSANYSWNSKEHYSIDAFSEGTAAMMFNYSWQIPIIRAKAPKLNFAVAQVPQFPGSPAVNYPNYFGFVVSKNKVPVSDTSNGGGSVNITNEQRMMEAWKLISFLTTRPEDPIEIKSNVAGTTQVTSSGYDPALEYMKMMNVPAARRDIVELQKNDRDISSFAYGNLIAKSWLQKSPDVIEGTFLEIIDDVNRGQMTLKEAVSMAAARIIQTTAE